jgi:hypothetical protein
MTGGIRTLIPFGAIAVIAGWGYSETENIFSYLQPCGSELSPFSA